MGSLHCSIMASGVNMLMVNVCVAFMVMYAVYSGCRLTFYEVIRDYVFKKDKNGRYPLW